MSRKLASGEAHPVEAFRQATEELSMPLRHFSSLKKAGPEKTGINNTKQNSHVQFCVESTKKVCFQYLDPLMHEQGGRLLSSPDWRGTLVLQISLLLTFGICLSISGQRCSSTIVFKPASGRCFSDCSCHQFIQDKVYC